MNSYKKLFNNVVIFGIGNLGSKIISFVLVPLYTYYLSQAEYGVSDLVFTTSNMLLPLVSAMIYEAILRFIMDKNNSDDTSAIMTNAFAISIIGFVGMLLFYPILSHTNFLEGSLIYLYILLFLQIFKQIFAQYARAIGLSKVFAIQGIITTFAAGIFNILFLVRFNMGLTGYFWAYILGYIITVVYLLLVINPLAEINLSQLNPEYMKKLLIYSIPLIPNSLMWWLINGSSRYFISWFIGVDANGLFAVSNRMPSFINIVSQVFSQAWQLSAFETYEEGDSTDFYSRIFDLYSGVLLLSTSLVIVTIKPLFDWALSVGFYTAWEPVPFLLLGSVFSALSGFIGVAYTASKQTKGVFKTSIYGGLISLILNILLIPTLGLIGAGVSSMISFYAMFLIRYFDTKGILTLNIQWRKLYSTVALILLQTIILFINIEVVSELVITCGILILLMMINKNIFRIALFLIKIKSK